MSFRFCNVTELSRSKGYNVILFIVVKFKYYVEYIKNLADMGSIYINIKALVIIVWNVKLGIFIDVDSNSIYLFSINIYLSIYPYIV